MAAKRATSADSPQLMMGIPKKLVPSSPVRNTIRRVVKESHRAHQRRHPVPLADQSVLVRLLRLPVDANAPVTDERGRTLRAFVRRPQDRAFKRLVRTEIDHLFDRLSAQLATARHEPVAPAGRG